MPTKSVTFDFFTYKCPSNQASLVHALEWEYIHRTNNMFNNIKLFDYYCRIWEIDKTPEGYYLCNVEKINVLDEANIGDLQAQRTTVATTPQQGPLFDTGFFYNPKNQVIILQRNRNGLGYKSFLSYLMKITNRDDISLELILDPDTLIKLNKMSLVKKLEYTISKPTNLRFSSNPNRSLEGDLELAKTLSGDSLRIEIGSDKGRQLTIEKAKTKVRSLLGLTENITRLNVRGQIGEDIETIDLIKNRVIYTEKFSLTQGKRVTVPMVLDTLTKAYKYHETNLNRMYINRV
ncbi:hypothetical protein J7E79_23075 [Bacillus sp. ISL-40]|uniref:DUF6731 family protein n=1 Tax=Bacillus sp. ISL-40 TaxID=2819126 RepID=UPI001BE763A1|nr:DUF6731 family protein [Bacillus sp. ISL-40]MBT2700252.1 hypothetical protein [Bacillus sp. ISL-40]